MLMYFLSPKISSFTTRFATVCGQSNLNWEDTSPLLRAPFYVRVLNVEVTTSFVDRVPRESMAFPHRTVSLL